jgi:hypothetical protein
MNRRHSGTAEKTGGTNNRLRKNDRSMATAILFQPWFLPQRVTYKIHGLVPPIFWKKMRYFFEDYGCLICGTESNYHSNGMCQKCYSRIEKKMMRCVKRRSPKPGQRLDLELFRQEKLAGKLLAKFSRRRPGGPKARRIEPERSNPVYEALSARFS